MSNLPITLLTDFGTQDTYVGQMRGVIAGIAPTTPVIDLTHAVPAQDLLRGAVLLVDAVEAFPEGTIHVAVIDPGVGSERRAIAAEIGRWRFVRPDNGLLTAVLDRWPLGRAVSLTNPQFFRSVVSRTFHGRDVFAPVAAHWAQGATIDQFGPMVPDPLVRLPWPRPHQAPGQIDGEVLLVDRFGNLITNITADHLPPSTDVQIRLGPHRIGSLSDCYAVQPDQPLALISSSGRLEVAIGHGSAAARWQLGIGAPVTVEWSE